MKNMIDPFKPGWHSAVITGHLQVTQANPLVPPGCPQPFHPGGSLRLSWSCLLLSHSYLIMDHFPIHVYLAKQYNSTRWRQ